MTDSEGSVEVCGFGLKELGICVIQLSLKTIWPAALCSSRTGSAKAD